MSWMRQLSFVASFVALAMGGCGGEDGGKANSVGPAQENAAGIDAADLGEFASGSKASIEVKVTSGVRPQISWTGGKISQLLVAQSTFLGQLGAEEEGMPEDPFMWWVLCADFDNCMSSPVTYRQLPPGTVDFLGALDDLAGQLGEETTAFAAALAPDREYVAVVNRQTGDGIAWGAALFKP